jgi:hypothetical protein
MADAPQLQIPPGIVACTTYGQIRGETSEALMNMRSHSERNGLLNVSWRMIPGTLVDKARNDATRELLRNPQLSWLLFCDGDMTFQQDALIQLLSVAYGSHPHVDVLGAYCTLRGDLALPTIDRGSGTWESVFPGQGVVSVIRTGAAFVLIKRHVFEALKEPWYCLRVPSRPIDFLLEVDNFARTKMNGENPFVGLPGEPWEKLVKCAEEDPSIAQELFTRAEVGEDSNFTDRARNAGFHVAVHTDVVTGHIDVKTTDWRQHKKSMDEMRTNQRQVVGLLR